MASGLDQVIYTFKLSGLKYLYLNDNFLIKKIKFYNEKTT